MGRDDSVTSTRGEPAGTPNAPTPTAPARRRAGRGLAESAWPVVALCAAAVAIALLAHHLVFPAYSWNRDEPVYLWQVAGLRAGQFTMTDGGAALSFHPWLSAAEGGVLFSQYTLGWPLVILAGDLVGYAPAALALGALLTVLGTYLFAREVTQDRPVALVAAAIMTFSPIIAIQGGVYLGYLFTLGLGLLFATALLAGVRRERPWLLVAAGLMLGYIFLTRPYDAVLWGLAIGGWVLWERRGEWARLLRAAAWLALGALPLVVATLAYNQHVTGSITEFPITVADPLDRFGFGRRRIMPTFGKADYSPFQAVKSTLRHGGYLPLFLLGAYLGIAVALWTAWRHRRDRTTWLLLAVIAVFPVGYFFFWGTFVSAATANLSGPIYDIPLYAPLAILIATAIVELWRTRPRWAQVLVAALVVVTVPFAVSRIDINHRLSEQQLAWKHGTDAVDGRALVFVPGTYLMFLNPYSRNDPDLSNRVLYAVDRGPENLDLIASHRDRTPYLQRSSLAPEQLVPGGNPLPLRVWTQAIHTVDGAGWSLRVRVRDPGRHRFLAVFLQIGDRVERRVLASRGRDHTLETEFRVRASDAAGVVDAVALQERLGTITTGLGWGRTANEARDRMRLRQRFPYRLVDGRVELQLPAVKSRWHLEKGAKKKTATWRNVVELRELDTRLTPLG